MIIIDVISINFNLEKRMYKMNNALIQPQTTMSHQITPDHLKSQKCVNLLKVFDYRKSNNGLFYHHKIDEYS